MTDAIGSMGRVDDLEGWLCAATKGLGDAGRERVAGEIWAHYKDAVEVARREGKSLVEAKQVAIEGLGKAKKANRVFRRTYLTDWDEEQLQFLGSSLWAQLKGGTNFRRLAIINGLFLFAYFAVRHIIGNPEPDALFVRIFLGLILLCVIHYGLGRYLVRIGALDRLPLWAAGIMLSLIPFVPLFFWGQGISVGDLRWTLIVPVFSAVLLRNAYRLWTIYRKIRVLGEDSSRDG